MKRHVLMYGLIGGILIVLLRWMEYQFLVVEHSFEIYGGLIAATFAVLGIWLGLKLTGHAPDNRCEGGPHSGRGTVHPGRKKTGGSQITRRELEILQLIARAGATARSPRSSL